MAILFHSLYDVQGHVHVNCSIKKIMFLSMGSMVQGGMLLAQLGIPDQGRGHYGMGSFVYVVYYQWNQRETTAFPCICQLVCLSACLSLVHFS